MTVLRSALDIGSPEFAAARTAMETKVHRLLADLEPALLGRVEELIDFVTVPGTA